MSAVGLLGQLDPKAFNIFVLPLQLIVTAAFFAMLAKDTELSRRVFMFVYLAVSFTLSMFGWWVAFDRVEEEKPWKIQCEVFEKDGGLKKHGYTDMSECNAKVKEMVYSVLITIMILMFFLLVHLNQVVYTHWRNAGLPKELGGTGNDSEGRRLRDEVDAEDQV